MKLVGWELLGLIICLELLEDLSISVGLLGCCFVVVLGLPLYRMCCGVNGSDCVIVHFVYVV